MQLSGAHRRFRGIQQVAFAGHERALAGGMITLVCSAWLLPAVVPLPALAQDAAARPAAALAGWLVAVLAAHVGGEPSWQLFATSGSRPRVINALRILVTALAGVAAIGWFTGTWFTAFNAVTALLGWALIAAATLGHRHAWALPTIHLFAALALAGSGTGSDLPAWAWILSGTPDATDLTLSAVLLTVGVILWGKSPTRQADEQA